MTRKLHGSALQVRGLKLLLGLAVLVLLVGCGGGNGSSDEASIPRAEQAQPTAEIGRGEIDPCALVTSAEAAHVLGAPVDAERPSELNNEYLASCRYVAPRGGSVAVLVVKVSRKNGSVGFQTARRMEELGVKIQPVPGIGDDAFWVEDEIQPPFGTSSAHEAAARLLGRMQMPDGRWRVTAPRVPLESSDIKATATAIRALRAYAPDDDETRARADRARGWLLNARASTTDDLCFRLLGLGWSGVRGAPLDGARDALAREQRDDGGWSQQPWMNTDAYATALALLALHDSGAAAATDDIYQRGVRYLLRTQHADGSWFVPKRAPSFNRYFDSGFPHGKHQFISFAATGLATMALLHTRPAAPH